MQLSNSVDEIFFDFAGSLFRASRTKNIIRFHLATKLRSLSTSNNHYCNQNPELTLLSVQKWVYILIIFCCHILILSCGNNLICLRCDEGHYDRLEKVSENCCIHSSKLFTFKYCQLPVTYSDCLKVMSIVSAITTYFSHSNYATHHLKEELKKEKDQRGIQVAGATRFSSFSIHARSISRCLHPIQRCLASGTVKFDTAAVSFFFISAKGLHC